MNEERMSRIENYINDLINQYASSGITLSPALKERLINSYRSSNASINEIEEKISETVERFIKETMKVKHGETTLKEENGKELSHLDVRYQGITLNIQDIELIQIVDAKSPEELKKVIAEIPRIKDENFDFTQDLETVIEDVFNKYQDTLLSKREVLENPGLELQRKIELFMSSSDASPEVKEKIRPIIEQETTKEEIIKKIEATLTEEEQHESYGIINNLVVVEKEGIKKTNIEAVRNLLEQVRAKDSITLDDVGKYSSLALEDGTLDFTKLQKALEFAKKEGKEVRLNALIFYMDCPDKFYQLEQNEKNHDIVKKALMDYVDQTTRFIKENGYEDTVRSIDVFNELLNRFAMEKEPFYEYRGDITPPRTNDNEIAGWHKHLTIEDLCDVISVARKNLPNTDFMYNDDNILDPKKWDGTRQLLTKIRDYEKAHDIKLIDSIGTQMHINDEVTGKDIKEMFHFLNEFHLPVEITEFDLAMTHKIDIFSGKTLEILRQQQLNEIYKVLEQEANLRGFTIWSKTDNDNFRLTLENERRKKVGEPLIDTLYGGYYTNNYEEKSKALSKSLNRQNFNYHTHTNRCGHASIAKDEEYVKACKESGITQLGFSDHIPFTSIEYPNPKLRMPIDSLDEYLFSIRRLQQENSDINILCGLESEYEENKLSYLNEVRDRLDYMILGQHFVTKDGKKVKKETPEYPIEYAKSVCEAMETGIYDIVAHPDIFMEGREKLEGEEQQEFDKNALIASRMICEQAKRLQIPLELNLAGIIMDKPYPDKSFWAIAKEYQVPVLYGVDAHDPNQIRMYQETIEQLESRINVDNLNFLPSTYNPKESRKENGLEERRQQTRENFPSFEALTVKRIVTQALNSEGELPLDEKITQRIEQLQQKEQQQLEMAISKVEEKISETTQAKDKTPSEKAFLLNQAKTTIRAIKNASTTRSSLMRETLANTQQAKEEGCRTKEEYIERITSLTENSRKPQRKSENQRQNQELSAMLSDSKAPQTNTRPKTLTKMNSQNGITTTSGIVLLLGYLLLATAAIISIIS